MEFLAGRLKCGSGKCDTVKYARVENWKMQEYRLAAWKAEPRLFSETTLS